MVLIDESGMLLAPLVRRTLAPKGKTPVLLHKARHREKISLISALTISPRSQRLGLFFSSLINDSFDNLAVGWFVGQLLRHLRGPVIIVWDRGPMHRGPAIRELQGKFPLLQLESLPPYAPELNPVEEVWSYLKWSRLCNFAPRDSAELDRAAYVELDRIRFDQERLRSFWAGSDLPLPRALAS